MCIISLQYVFDLRLILFALHDRDFLNRERKSLIQRLLHPRSFGSIKSVICFINTLGFWFVVKNIRINDAMMRYHQISVKAFSMKVSFAQTLRFTLQWKLLLSILPVLTNNFVFVVTSCSKVLIKIKNGVYFCKFFVHYFFLQIEELFGQT